MSNWYRNESPPTVHESALGRLVPRYSVFSASCGSTDTRSPPTGKSTRQPTLVLQSTVPLALVREPEGDTLVLEQTADEIEVALAVLHTVVALGVAAAQPVVELGHRVFLEDRLDDLDGIHLLEDAAVGRP